MGKKPTEPEYRLNIFHHYDDETKKKSLVFFVRTIQEFATFNYEISLQDRIENNTIHLKIAGLNAPSSLMPGYGPARGKREHTGLKGVYVLKVQRLDGLKNEFKIQISRDQVRILESPNHPVVLISNEPVKLA